MATDLFTILMIFGLNLNSSNLSFLNDGIISIPLSVGLTLKNVFGCCDGLARGGDLLSSDLVDNASC